MPQCSLPKLGVDVTPQSKSDPRPLCHCISGEKELQMIVAYIFIQCTKPVMMYTDDAGTASSNVECHHGLRAQEQLVGNEWREAGYAHRLQVYESHPTKQKT